MCCENCPRYTSCEEEGHLNDICCASCPDYKSCCGKDGSKDKRRGEEQEDSIDAV